MNKNRIIKTAALVVAIIIILIYFINLISRVSNKKSLIRQTEQKAAELKKEIRLERKNQSILEKTNKNFLETAYFDKRENYFENYIRGLFNKYNIKIIIYQSKMNEKNYSEIDLSYNSDALTFFKLIKEFEEGDKIIVIRNLKITKLNVPNFQVDMKLGGYYKE